MCSMLLGPICFIVVPAQTPASFVIWRPDGINFVIYDRVERQCFVNRGLILNHVIFIADMSSHITQAIFGLEWIRHHVVNYGQKWMSRLYFCAVVVNCFERLSGSFKGRKLLLEEDQEAVYGLWRLIVLVRVRLTIQGNSAVNLRLIIAWKWQGSSNNGWCWLSLCGTSYQSSWIKVLTYTYTISLFLVLLWW